ncbi:hypothetical protein MIND_00169000 [Mycena indigotica]|uniref:protein-tyrosine-phosphatase n=1 Tax=Mycena indigotica TaxID=2126181 RepID=A0A8H6WF82_9AGAR|nr:uncharacterized protein MIND_00169000 [Mycena indigotica]KAF7316499.1 hypothetical protein MIND_00169000 [Mycena indigotica]
MSMDEIIPGLWVGDLPSATNTANLKANKIFSILSAMRGRVTINETFIRHQISLDDTEETDVLVHFIPAITFIQAELDKGRGVLVHCQAGMSRSVTIVAAYLMYTQNIDTEAALELIRQSRPNIDPNPGFLHQLEIFHQAAYKISRRDKSTRMFYMERAVEEVMNGDGSLPETTMFAKYPRTPSDSAPGTPGGPRRKIRCKMCRQELATREHMLDHGQLGAPTPAAVTPVVSRHPSMTMASRPRIGSFGTGARPRRPSGLGDTMLQMSALETEDDSPNAETVKEEVPVAPEARRTLSDPLRRPRLRPLISGVADLTMSQLSMSTSSALDTEDDSGPEDNSEVQPIPRTHPFALATQLGRRLSDAVIASPGEPSQASENVPEHAPTRFSSADDIAEQLLSNPKLAALRGSPVMSPLTPMLGSSSKAFPVSQPIIVNPKCSGYFVEPMKWMEPFLEEGQIAGKITCPNPKCGAKLGNYDWAGMCCGCKEWVTPIWRPPRCAADVGSTGKPLKFGCLGAAKITPGALVKPARTHPEVVLFAVAARDPKRAAEFATEHGFQKSYGGPNCYQDMLDDPDVDVVYNALPNRNELHFEWTMKAGKHVLLEKPATNTASEATAIFALAAQKNLVVLEAFHYRFHPAVQRVKSIIDSGELGVIETITATLTAPHGTAPDGDIRWNYELGGGATMDPGCYTVNVLRYLAGANPTAVLTARAVRYSTLPEHEKVDKMVWATLAMETQVVGEVHANLDEAKILGIIPRMPKLSATVECSAGKIEIFNFLVPHFYHRITVSPKGQRQRIEKAYSFNGNFKGEDWWTTYRYQLEAFVDKVQGRSPQTWIAGQDTVANVEWIEEIYAKDGFGSRPASSYLAKNRVE